MSEPSGSAWTLRDLCRPVFRFKRRVIGFFVGTILLALLGLILCPRKYESKAKLFVRVGHENASVDPTATTGQMISLQASRESEINSVVALLGSQSMVEKALEAMDSTFADQTPTERASAIKKVRRQVSVSSPRLSTVVSASCKARSPERAREIVAALVDVYLDEHMRMNRTSGSHQFFVEQTELLKNRLEEAQQALVKAKNELGIASIDARRNALDTEISQMQARVRQAEATRMTSSARVDTLRTSANSVPENLARQMMGGTPNDGLGQMREQLYALQIAEQKLLARCKEDHPSVMAMRRQVSELKQILAQELPGQVQTVTAVLAPEQATRNAAGAEAACLRGQLVDLGSELRELNERGIAIHGLEQSVGQLSANYVAYAGKLEQARIDQALKADRLSNVSVVQPATFNPSPVSPKPMMALALAMFAATCGSLGLAVLSDRLDNTMASTRDVETTLELPVLTSIPRVSTPGIPMHGRN